mmetsp:Transcript_43317/g.128294  ORF Transcript_43317/g.128294 Transcript_43317/m.128294 type:complete len:119 (+) Transcript_43317:121-477(+)
MRPCTSIQALGAISILGAIMYGMHLALVVPAEAGGRTDLALAADRRLQRARVQQTLAQSRQAVSDIYQDAERASRVEAFLAERHARVEHAGQKVGEALSALAPVGPGAAPRAATRKGG